MQTLNVSGCEVMGTFTVFPYTFLKCANSLKSEKKMFISGNWLKVQQCLSSPEGSPSLPGPAASAACAARRKGCWMCEGGDRTPKSTGTWCSRAGLGPGSEGILAWTCRARCFLSSWAFSVQGHCGSQRGMNSMPARCVAQREESLLFPRNGQSQLLLYLRIQTNCTNFLTLCLLTDSIAVGSQSPRECWLAPLPVCILRLL